MPTAEIVGGGIAGLVAAIQLARSGWIVRLHERSEALRAGGNGLPIFENGLRILEALGLGEAVRTRGHQLDKWIIRLSSGETTRQYEPFAATGGRIVMFQRQSLVDPLAEAAVEAGVKIETGSRVLEASREGVLRLQDGRRLEADLVVGADGINSVVRRSVAGELPLGKHRKGAIRLLIPIYPGDFPDGNDRVATEYNDPNGRRIGLLPCSSSTMYMILVALLSDAEALRMPISPELWKTTFPTLGKFIDRVGAEGHYDEYHSVFPPAWHYGKSVLIGDAAHGMTPALGQGANSAMMTAYSLGATDLRTGSLSDALTAWEAKIRPLVHFTQKFAEGITEGRLDPRNDIFFSDPALRPLLTADIPNMRFDMPDFDALNPRSPAPSSAMKGEPMFQKPPAAELYDTLADTSGYARPTDDFGEAAVADPLENLQKLRQMLIDKRRYLAQDAMTYPVVFLGRAQDIADVQNLLNSLEQAIAHEQALQTP